ncbi:MAG: CueP family metal-binding protein [Chloroflexota bacterium]
MRLINIIALMLVLVIVGCSNSTEPDPNYDEYYYKLTDLDAKAAIALGNEWKFSAPKITSHVTTEEVIFKFPDGREVKKPIPAGSVYIAFAPYINNTHTCEQHYLSSCDGEMKEKTFKVTAILPDGKPYVSEDIKSLKNGFFELWLPNNRNMIIKIEYDGKKGEETIPTFPGSRTCITTIQLK